MLRAVRTFCREMLSENSQVLVLHFNKNGVGGKKQCMVVVILSCLVNEQQKIVSGCKVVFPVFKFWSKFLRGLFMIEVDAF